MSETKPRLADRWRALSAALRRRIVLGSLLGLSLAARDLVLFVFTAGLFTLAELAPTRALAGRPTA